MGINLRWNVSLSSFPCQATRDGEVEEAPTPQNPPTKAAAATKTGRRGLRVFFLKVFGSVLRVGPESGGKYCRDQQESACRPEVLFAASDSIPWQTGCSLPPLPGVLGGL